MIYLDLDGVMLTGKDYSSKPYRITAERVAMVNRLLDATGTSLVLSSTWRRGSEGRRILTDAGLWPRMAHLADPQADWHTPFALDEDDQDDSLSLRGQEIRAHALANGVARYLVLDDGPVLADQPWVRIDGRLGLTDADVRRAIRMWKSQGGKP